jgi:hypothetical protein
LRRTFGFGGSARKDTAKIRAQAPHLAIICSGADEPEEDLSANYYSSHTPSYTLKFLPGIERRLSRIAALLIPSITSVQQSPIAP